jgi:hypothetical protein
MDVESEIRDLKRRVGELEGSFSFLTGQVRDVHRSLLGFQEETNTRFDRVDDRFDRVEADLGGVKADLGGVKDDVRRLREDMPGIVGGAVREALRDR